VQTLEQLLPPAEIGTAQQEIPVAESKVYVVLTHSHPDLLDDDFHGETIIDSVHRTKDGAISRAQALEIRQLERELQCIREDPKYSPRLYSRYAVRPFELKD
tara:strand:+ start:274 stop:579 length:306 start_codon:yes stop_codon:yes gene_type:complete